MSGKISQMPVVTVSAATNTIEVVVSGVSSQMTLATAVKLAHDAAPTLAANLDAASFSLTNIGGLLPRAPAISPDIPLGSAALPFQRLHYGAYLVTTTVMRNGFQGGHVYYDAVAGKESDLFFGHDSTFPGFYAQRTITKNSARTDTNDDFTNLYQGGLSEEYVAIAYQAGGYEGSGGTAGVDDIVSSGAINQPMSGTLLKKGGITVGAYSPSSFYGGAGIMFAARAQNTVTTMQHELDTSIYWTMRSGGFGMGSGSILGWRIGGAISHIGPSNNIGATNDNAIDLGLAANRWKDGHFAGTLNAGEARFTNDTLSAVANTVNVGSVDLSAGNTMLAWYGEGTSVGSTTPTADKTIAVQVNGTTYYLLASTIT